MSAHQELYVMRLPTIRLEGKHIGKSAGTSFEWRKRPRTAMAFEAYCDLRRLAFGPFNYRPHDRLARTTKRLEQ
jgi:hypothetical protein